MDETRPDVDRLGRRAVERGLLDQAALARCLAELRDEVSKEDPASRLIQKLVRDRLLSASQLAGLLRDGGSVPDRSMIDRYEIVREVGRGGMGVVYEAIDPSLGRVVAIKVLLDESDRHLRRLHREAAYSAQLSHPGIVKVHEIGRAEETGGGSVDYIVMELVDGPSLEDALPSLSTDDRLRVLARVADAVGHAHAKGVIHRDLKPANILLRDGGQPVVVDFGLARQDDDATSRLTTMGTMLGTVRYMSPEQVEGRVDEVDTRSDVWALGVMLYQLTTDVMPFDGRVAPEVCLAIRNSHPRPPIELSPDLPPPVSAICMKALEKSPERRYATAADMALELERALRGERVEARPLSASRRIARNVARRPGLSGLAVVLLVVAVAGGWWLRRSRVSGPEHDAEVQKALETQRRELAAAARAGELNATLEPIARLVEQTRPLFYIDDPAPLLTQIREVEAALVRLEKLVESDRAAAGEPRVWSLLGRGWYVVGRLPRAESALRKAIDLGTADPADHGALGRILVRRSLATLISSLSKAARERAAVLADEARTVLAGADVEAADRARGELDREVVRGYLAMAGKDYSGAKSVCEAALQRFGREPGTEEFVFLLGWMTTRSKKKYRLWTKAIERCPHDAWLLFARGTMLSDLGRHAEALSDLDRSIRLNPHLWISLASRALVRTVLDDPEGAIADCDAALALAPNAARAYRQRGRARMKLGQESAALADYEKAIELDPQLSLTYYDRAAWAHRKGKTKQALADFSKAIELYPEFTDAYLGRGLVLQSLGDHDDALADFTKAIELGGFRASEAHVSRGKLQILRNDIAASRADFTKAIELDGNNASAYYERAKLSIRLRDPAGAMADLTKAIQIAPKWPQLYIWRSGLYPRARAADALADLDRALKLDPENGAALANRGGVYMRMGKADLAIADLTRALAVRSGVAAIHLVRGQAYRHKRSYDEALADFDAALKIDPKLVMARVERARIRVRRGDVDGALADARRVIARAPRMWQGHAVLGQALMRKGERAEARSALQKAVQLAPPSVRTSLQQWIRRLSRGG